MVSNIYSSAVSGVDAYMVEVEVDISPGLPQFSTVGLAEGAVRESKERVRSAIKNCKYDFPQKRITVNLAPADRKKEGSSFDLPISLGILCASGTIDVSEFQKHLVLGELSLDGRVKSVKGVLPAAIFAKKIGMKGIFVPEKNAREAAVVDDIDVFPVLSLQHLIEHLKGVRAIQAVNVDREEIFKNNKNYSLNFSDVKGQQNIKRSMEIAASGGHNVLMVGSPGTGKTMIARRVPTILPDISFEEALETSKIYSILGLLPKNKSFIYSRPFRSPHHTISDAGLIGGGAIPKPGEASLAHNGVLFLDELPEFKKNVIEVLRQPVEDGLVTISRATGSITYPSNFMLVGAMNPCPCGFFGDRIKQCTCSHLQIHKYRSKVSGPLLDRFDMHVEVPSLNYQDLVKERKEETSEKIRERVNMAREVQLNRFRGTDTFSNSQMTPEQLKDFCRLCTSSSAILERAIKKLSLSARAYHKIIKVSRTIADLNGSSDIKQAHLLEAVQFRTLDRS